MPKEPSPKKPAARDVTIDPNSRATVSGPAESAASEDSADLQTAQLAAPLAPAVGVSVEPSDPLVGASTVSEVSGSEKVGSGAPPLGVNKTIAPLDRVRVDSSKRGLTTNQCPSRRPRVLVQDLCGARAEPATS